MNKKLIFVSLLLICLILGGGVYAFNNNTATEVIYSAEEIKDINILYNRAKEDISDLDSISIKKYGIMKNADTNEENAYNQTSYQTTQLLSIEKDASGRTVKKYATTSFIDLETPSLTSEGKSNFKTSAYYGDDDVDNTISVRVYGTIYWDWVTYLGCTFFDVYRYTGGYTILDNQVSVTSYNLRIGASGYGESGWFTSQIKDYNNLTSSTFSYSEPSDFNWEMIKDDDIAGYNIGERFELTLKRGLSSWTTDYLYILVP